MAYEIISEDEFFGAGVEVSRPVNDVSINGSFENLLDSNGQVRVFKSVEDAKEFLRRYYDEEYIDTLRFRYSAACLQCGTKMVIDVGDVSEDELGRCYTCPKCGKSFDVM